MMTAAPSASTPCTYEDRPVRWFLVATVAWALLSAALGCVLTLLLVLPKLFYELGEPAQHLSFGRLYPTQMQILLYGFIGNGFFAFLYFAVQRLTTARLALPTFALLHWFVWQTMTVGAVITSITLQNQGRWFGWMVWPLDLLLIASWWLLLTPSIAITIARRTPGSRISPPLWFALASMLAVPVLQLVNNLSFVFNSAETSSAYVGVQDMMVQWWTGRGMASFWMTVPAVAVLYYLVPRLAGGRLFSYRLTVLHFWSIALLGCWGGNFQWHLTALPEWADSLAMFAGLFLWLGCLAGAYNLWRSLPKSVNRAARSTSLRLTTASVICYAIYSLDSLWMSFKGSASSAQFTDWSSGNLLLAILGVSGLSLIAFSLTVFPSLFAVNADDRRGSWLRWLAVEGAAIQVIALYVAGQVQAYSWNELNELGRLEYSEFVNALGWVAPLWMIAAVGAVCWLLAVIAWLLLTVQSIVAGRRAPISIVAGTVSAADPVLVESPLRGAPVLGFAVAFERWVQMAWHATLERNQSRMVRRVAVGLLVGIGLFWAPSWIYRGTSQTAVAATQGPYTELELIGRDIYIREGCVSCHTQASRPLVSEVLRYGDVSRPEDYQKDRPVQIGFRRVGPDLAKEGGRRTSGWHWRHLENPQSVTPESVMPAFDHLLNESLSFEENPVLEQQAQQVAAEIVGEGGPVMYGDRLIIQSRAMALIAYLQRLGVAGISDATVNEQLTPTSATVE
jgi:cytochrome c oxidase cbb3-type subunit I/II